MLSQLYPYCFSFYRLLLQHCLSQLRSTQVAVVHCSAQTAPSHVLQKLGQMCMVISSNTGRVYRPKDCERLILYLKDLNLPKPDKWGTSQLIAFLHQVWPTDQFSLDCFLYFHIFMFFCIRIWTTMKNHVSITGRSKNQVSCNTAICEI